MPDGNALSALYPQPPAQQNQNQNLLSDPAKVIGLMGAVQDYRLKQQQFDALSQQPQASLEGQRIQNETAQLEQSAKKQAFIIDWLGARKNDPNLNLDQLRSDAVTMARNLGIPGQMVNSWLHDLPKEKEALHARLGQMQNHAIGATGIATRVTGSPDASGAPQTTSLGEANNKGTFPTGLAPGESVLAESAAGRAANLQSSASTSPQYRADLENLRTDSKILDNLGGPSFEVEKKLNQLTNRIGGFGITMTPEQLKAGESFDKIINGISLRQAQQFGGTDSSRHMTLGATPNTGMSKYGREAMIDMAQGNQDFIDAARRAWLRARANEGVPVKDHDLFVERFNQESDPRVFQFNRLSKENQQKFIENVDPSDHKEFEAKIVNAFKKKWIDLKNNPELAKVVREKIKAEEESKNK